ncbi:MAG: S41 family peptidase [Anaerolineales bacterium]
MNSTSRFFAACFTVILWTAFVFTGGFALGRVSATHNVLSFIPGLGGTDPAVAGTPAELQTTFRPFWQAWDAVHENYVEQPVDDVQLMRGAIRGMLAALDDPYTAYMTPEELTVNMSHLDGELEGIGATVETDDKTGYTRIVSPMAGSPAEVAGILPGDLILSINGEDIAGQDITTVVSKVRGAAGSTVQLSVQRAGRDDPLEFTITRAKINIASVEGKVLDGNIGYVKINSFGEKTASELKTQLRAVLNENPVGLILDLRGNPGGYLDTAIEVVSQFIPNGVVMLERFGDGEEKTYEALSGGLATDIPLVVLIDKGSASASEIVAGAVQDRGRGTLVGETSFGKGSVQTSKTLVSDGGLRITIARWMTPNGNWIHKQGIAPDVAVERTEEDRAAQRDPQLEKAIEILAGK